MDATLKFVHFINFFFDFNDLFGEKYVCNHFDDRNTSNTCETNSCPCLFDIYFWSFGGVKAGKVFFFFLWIFIFTMKQTDCVKIRTMWMCLSIWACACHRKCYRMNHQSNFGTIKKKMPTAASNWVFVHSIPNVMDKYPIFLSK